LGSGLVTLSATATTVDFDNDTATAVVSVDLGGNLSFDDDVPSVTAGAVAMAAPAHAVGTGKAVYSCTASTGQSYPSVAATFVRNASNNLTLTAAIAPGVGVVANDLSGVLSWGGSPPNITGLKNPSMIPPGGPVVLTKTGSAALPSAPTSISLTVISVGATVSCTLTSTTSWPAGGI